MSTAVTEVVPETRGQIIRRVRTKVLLIPQAELARRIEAAAEADGATITISKSAVCRWESGKSDPALRHLRYVAGALGIEAAELVEAPS